MCFTLPSYDSQASTLSLMNYHELLLVMSELKTLSLFSELQKEGTYSTSFIRLMMRFLLRLPLSSPDPVPASLALCCILTGLHVSITQLIYHPLDSTWNKDIPFVHS